MDENDFEPKPGRIRTGRSGRARRYLAQVIAATQSAGSGPSRSTRRFDGSRIGRGASMARMLGDRLSARRARRVVVKTRLVRLGPSGLGAAAAHLRYIQRDGVTREGEPGRLYSASEEVADARTFNRNCADDRHQFRFIVSAEDADQLGDLKPFIRKLMRAMEEDLGTKLDWVAVDHFNTGHPHSHVVLRGKDDRGANLVIARDYISSGLRARAMQIVGLELGPRTDLEIEASLSRDVDTQRLTSIDRKLLGEMDVQDRVWSSARDPFEQSLRAGRLALLGRMGLAHPNEDGSWRLAGGLEATLRQMGARGDIIRTMQRELSARTIERSIKDQVIYDPGSPDASRLVGRLLARGLADEHQDRHYLLVDAADGRIHHVDIGKAQSAPHLPEGAIISVAARRAETRAADQVIADVAKLNSGIYTAQAHLAQDQDASGSFVAAHVRRLEAMRRRIDYPDRKEDGSWRIAKDHLERAAAFERGRLKDHPVEVQLLSPVPLEQLAEAQAATWLDRELEAGSTTPLRDCGFGREARAAQIARRQWLIAEGLGLEVDGSFTMRPDAVALLQRRELLRVAAGLGRELELDFVETAKGDQVSGKFVRTVDLASGRFALIERARDFTLVPWRPMLDAHVGRTVSGLIRESGPSWTIGRERGGPAIG